MPNFIIQLIIKIIDLLKIIVSSALEINKI